MGVLVQALTRRETPIRDLRPFMRGPEPRRGVARGLLVEALVGGSLFLWGKIFDVFNVFAFSRVTASLTLILLSSG